jgi:uncharacterized protein DUF3631
MSDEAVIVSELRAHFARYVSTMEERDSDLLTLWALHTHVFDIVGYTPRLVIDSNRPGSGKTVTLEHLRYMVSGHVDVATATDAVLPRLMAKHASSGHPITFTLDEVQHIFSSPDALIVQVLKHGFREGATRAIADVNDPHGVIHQPLFSAVAMAGLAPRLTDEVQSRSLRVLLTRGRQGDYEPTRWTPANRQAASRLGRNVADWACSQRGTVRGMWEAEDLRSVLPTAHGRDYELWIAMKLIALCAGGRWPGVVDAMVASHLADQVEDDEARAKTTGELLLEHCREVWPEDVNFVGSVTLMQRLIDRHPEAWGPLGQQPINPTWLGITLKRKWGVRTDRTMIEGSRLRGYFRASFSKVWERVLGSAEATASGIDEGRVSTYPPSGDRDPGGVRQVVSCGESVLGPLSRLDAPIA